ncbi:hypothetical protein GCM10009557_40650 [Virgisporangium ochraceum]|uniref:Uncharacterized protein n=1 Tax=Virgisporangium ochraceum TaxID=65505 RepID=A0A8J4A4Q8_9ACTN|nr:hypothetical protein [Virgisporangium ochraceum]GIJ74883.1 hypothetical protein Voc01_098000 [Virgisporangium ochraceum]
MSLIWATRGRAWGFRFLLDGGYDDPLGEYEATFSGVGDEPEVCRRVGDRVALRFPDPLERRDAAGRVIPHDFVVSGPSAEGLDSVEDGLRRVWQQPGVADRFDRIWDGPPPA